MSGKAAKTQLTTHMQKVLRQLAFSRNVGNGIVTRAKIILMAFQKNDNQTIGRQLELCGKTVGIWRRRWQDSFEKLISNRTKASTGATRPRRIPNCFNNRSSLFAKPIWTRHSFTTNSTRTPFALTR